VGELGEKEWDTWLAPYELREKVSVEVIRVQMADINCVDRRTEKVGLQPVWQWGPLKPRTKKSTGRGPRVAENGGATRGRYGNASICMPLDLHAPIIPFS
jgi:hypothetical protein